MDIPSPEVLSRIRSNAELVRKASTELTARIRAYEVFLASLPGKVPVHLVIGESKDGHETSFLSFQKWGTEWCLVTYDQNDDYGTSNSELLRDGPLERKAYLLRKLPELLVRIADQQVTSASVAENAIRDFDAFAKQIGLKEGK